MRYTAYEWTYYEIHTANGSDYNEMHTTNGSGSIHTANGSVLLLLIHIANRSGPTVI